jgi:hypothetical protein
MDEDCGCEEKTWPKQEDESGDNFINNISTDEIKSGLEMKKQSLLNRMRSVTAPAYEEQEKMDSSSDEEVEVEFVFMPVHEKCMPNGCLPKDRDEENCPKEIYDELVKNNYPFCVNTMEENRLNNMKIIDILQKLEKLK